MTEKVHWKTAQKLAKEAEIVEGTAASIEAPVVPAPKVVSKWYNIFDARANLVGFSPIEVEAPVGGFIKAL